MSLTLPSEGATLMHRAGRTGRFGTMGLAVTMVTAAELDALQAMVAAAGGRPVQPMPERLPDGMHGSSSTPSPTHTLSLPLLTVGDLDGCAKTTCALMCGATVCVCEELPPPPSHSGLGRWRVGVG